MALEAITEWIQERYPKSRLDPEWTTACVDFLQTELRLNPATQFDEITRHVQLQLLQSDLSDSMLRSTGFPAGLRVPGGMKKGVIGTRASGGAILVQIVGIMEVGNSAFTLGNVRQARLDKADMTGLTRDREEAIDAEGGAGGGANGGEEEEDATMPPYPRSMLSLLLSDGTATIKAMEIKRLSDLILGETQLGFKLLLKSVPIRNGIALLEPGNVELLGHHNDELQSRAEFKFMNALRKRMGKPDLEAPDDQQEEGSLPSPPGHPERVNVPDPPTRAQVPRNQPQRPVTRTDESDYFDDFSEPPEELSRIRLSPPLGGLANPTISPNTRANPAPARQACPTPRRQGVIHTSSDPPVGADGSFGREDIDVEMDEEFWQEFDAVEDQIIEAPVKTASSGRVAGARETRQQGQPQSARGVAAVNGVGRRNNLASRADIIELDDSDDEEREKLITQSRTRQQANARVVDTIDLSD